MNYLEFYQLTQEPFSNAPDTRFYYNSAQHARALLRLMTAVEGMKGLAVLIGDIGTGKTTLARRMLDSLPEEEYEAALLVIIHSGITADWLLRKITLQLGVQEPSQEKLTLLSQLYERLMELYEHKKKAVVLVDEAQMLQSREIMEEIRGLLNLEVPERKLITFVFFGLPEIDENLKLDEPLAQRVALKYRLESFNEESTEAYIKHRMRLAGAQSDHFSHEAVKLIHRYSKGVPRMINVACDNALFEGFLLKQKVIDGELIENIAMDLGLVKKEEAPSPASEPAVQRLVQPPVQPAEQGGEPDDGRVAQSPPPMPPPPAKKAERPAPKPPPSHEDVDIDSLLDNIVKKE